MLEGGADCCPSDTKAFADGVGCCWEVPKILLEGFSVAWIELKSILGLDGWVELWPKANSVLAGAGLSCGAGDAKLNAELGPAGCARLPKMLFPGLSCAGPAAELPPGLDVAG